MTQSHICQLIGCHSPARTKHRGLWMCPQHVRERSDAKAENLSQWTDLEKTVAGD